MKKMLTNSSQKMMIQKKQVKNQVHKSGQILYLGGNKNKPGLQKIKQMAVDPIRRFHVAQKYI